MRILVIGNGLIGNAITEALLEEGHNLHIYSRRPAANHRISFTLGNIHDIDSTVSLLSWNPQVIIYTAWITTPGIYKQDETNYLYANSLITFTERIMDSFDGHFIVLGTCAEYGNQTSPVCAGTTKVSPSSFYAREKVRAFCSIKEMAVEAKFRFTWARVFNPYGKGQDERRLIPVLINSIRLGKEIALLDTSSKYDWISTRDIASAISWTITNILPEEIDVATSIGYTNLEVLKTLQGIMKSRYQLSTTIPKHNKGVNEHFVASADSPLFRSGWSPRDNLKSGLTWMVT